MLSYKERYDMAENTVTKLNCYLEKHQYEPEFSDMYMKDIVDEAGFGYTDKNVDTLQFIVGDNICNSKYSMQEASDMIKDGITTQLIFELFNEQ